MVSAALLCSGGAGGGSVRLCVRQMKKWLGEELVESQEKCAMKEIVPLWVVEMIIRK